ncbi:class I SAM-dependent methyltransferase [Candidatus Parcubacteria bacterium]|nr:class I SAM-dependent methyltransferase [Candidatus Parcubacteria bacterium]
MISLILFLNLLLLAFLIIFVSYLLIQLYFASSMIFGAPFMPSPTEKVKRMLELASPRSGEILYDLGSGNGKILFEAVKQYKVRAIGVEINPVLVWLSRRKIKKLGLEDKIKIYQGNFFKKNLSDADIILTYLWQPTMGPLEKKLLSELKPGTRLVSLAFTFDNIPFVKSDSEYSFIRLYQIPR